MARDSIYTLLIFTVIFLHQHSAFALPRDSVIKTERDDVPSKVKEISPPIILESDTVNVSIAPLTSARHVLFSYGEQQRHYNNFCLSIKKRCRELYCESKSLKIPGRLSCTHEEATEDPSCLEHCLPKGYSYGLCVSHTCSCI